MIRSFCILNSILYYSSGELPELLTYLDTNYKNDTGRVVLEGQKKYEKCSGKFHIFGNKGARKAMPYLEKYFSTPTTIYVFEESNSAEYCADIKSTKYIHIHEMSFDEEIELLRG